MSNHQGGHGYGSYGQGGQRGYGQSYAPQGHQQSRGYRQDPRSSYPDKRSNSYESDRRRNDSYDARDHRRSDDRDRHFSYRDRDEPRRNNRDRDEGPGLPNIQVIFQGLEPHTVESDLQRVLEEQGASVESVVLIRDKETKESRCFAFAKFVSVEHARQYVEQHYPYMAMGPNQHRVKIAYSRETRGGEEGWTCKSCETLNYSRREACFKCNLAKTDSEGTLTRSLPPSIPINDGTRDSATSPSQFLLLRNLDPLTTEPLIARAITKLHTSATRILLVKDRATRVSWGFAFVECRDVDEAKKAMGEWKKQDGVECKEFTIRSRPVTVSFIHPGVFVPVYSDGGEYSFPGPNGIRLAYWDQGAFCSEYVVPVEGEAAIANENAEDDAMKAFYAEVGMSTFTSGPAAPEAGAMVNDPYSSTPMTVAPSAATEQSSSTADDKAKKAQGTKKRKAEVVPTTSRKMAPHLQKWAEKQQELRAAEAVKLGTSTPTTTTTAADPDEIEDWADLGLMACILCARQFKTEDEIRKHERLSELHKNNLADATVKAKAAAKLRKLRAKPAAEQLFAKPADESEAGAGGGYRDRAWERRQQFNQPSRPPPPPQPSSTRPPPRSPSPPQPPPPPSKGASLLAKMGWTSGQGLGSQNQGRVEAIKGQGYVPGVGLGMAGGKKEEVGDAHSRPGEEGTYKAYLEKGKERARARLMDQQD
ncbi:hypothetical protein SAICODRAFT_171139 [Saitoella complicata NRRL Y-17804]|uniref:RNA-binding protein n=1 Tax=Saitoella complicata (strain BCRC 22490 / CBS 7301 / JCM 7358 / NBRC 10748 / NRRL Y-17804) TaxID=698492 RepID=A0A0E9NRQ9_SAICN|nr:uncharacterized protein SAICODRAFT_171139 [Saitoella complicata NRRL Y-17804]ODQ50611.1 hypothetical protein SAICODRAFT_171139 [Saitoella complicata NRRL Y-17804]GAO52468.1 hypothetical protein G7K_6543-t1 [Saitoella complicata NRRL Y-17804]